MGGEAWDVGVGKVVLNLGEVHVRILGMVCRTVKCGLLVVFVRWCALSLKGHTHPTKKIR